MSDVTDDDAMRRPSLPASLAGADPFAPATPSTPAAAPAGPGRFSSSPSGTGDARGGNGAHRPVMPSDSTPSAVPCACSCRCGNDTDKTYADLESLAAARHLRCDSCGAQGHVGTEWQQSPTTRPGLGPADEVRTGERGGTTVIVRNRSVDPVEAEWEREAAQMLEDQRRDAARDRWLKSLPERWQMPYNDGETLLPEVEDRLQRIKSGSTVGTSMLCIGKFGTGKTWAAYTYARAAVDRRLLWPQEIRVGTEADIMEPLALASPWELADRSAALLKPTLKLLIIDDVGALGTYKNIENQHATWTKVINWAYEHKRAVVITTNRRLGTEAETAKEKRHELLERWIGPTAYERLKHMVGERQVFRDKNMRAEMSAQWEAEYQSMMNAKSAREF